MNKSYIHQWRSHGCIIRQRNRSFQVESSHAGKRVRETVATKEAADALAAQREADLKQVGMLALEIRGKDRDAAARLLQALPTEALREDVLEAVRLLSDQQSLADLQKPRRTPLAEAVRFYRIHHPHEAAMPTLQAALACYLEKKSNRRPTTLAEIRQKVGRFIAAYPAGATGADVTAARIDQWMSGELPTVATQRKYKRVLHGFFEFCRRQYHLPKNPAADVYLDEGVRDQREVESYTVEEARALMEAAAALPEAATVVPALAIGLFAGLRPAELDGLDWRDVSPSTGLIRVTPATAKKRRQRFVDIRPNLAAWLAPYAQESGRVAPSPNVFRRVRGEVLKRAGVKRWLRDGLRHSFGTYHLAAFGDAKATAAQMGHGGNTELLFQHYRTLVSRAVAEPFWRISPRGGKDDAGKVAGAAGGGEHEIRG